MRGTLTGGDPPFVIDLGSGDVTMTKQVLDFSDIDSGIEQERRSGRPE
jgi:hypothetical protein